jgi:hypothetical protein
MKQLTLHTTDLDSWVWFNRLEDMQVSEMVGRLLRTEPPNRKMLMGTAWHSVMENPPEQFSEIEMNGFKFVIECDAEIILPQCREIRACKTYQIGDIEVKTTGKCDGITGNEIADHKLTFNSKPENYFESRQWRSYMDIFNADIFKYIIYSAKERPEDGAIVIHDISTMDVYRYPEMIDDLKRTISDLVEFIKVHVPQMITS